MKRRLLTSLTAGLGLALSLFATPAIAEDMRIALVVKALGIGFFEAAAEGAEEAAAELGNVEIIYTGPTDTTAEGQIEVVNSLIAQGVDAIAISANDPDALIPSLNPAGPHTDSVGKEICHLACPLMDVRAPSCALDRSRTAFFRRRFCRHLPCRPGQIQPSTIQGCSHNFGGRLQ